MIVEVIPLPLLEVNDIVADHVPLSVWELPVSFIQNIIQYCLYEPEAALVLDDPPLGFSDKLDANVTCDVLAALISLSAVEVIVGTVVAFVIKAHFKFGVGLVNLIFPFKNSRKHVFERIQNATHQYGEHFCGITIQFLHV